MFRFAFLYGKTATMYYNNGRRTGGISHICREHAQNRDMKRKTFVRGAAVAGISGVAVKALGAMLRIPLIALIGCYGLGLYQRTYAFYAFAVTLCSAGITSAISKQTAELRALQKPEKPLVKAYLRLFLIVGACGGAVLAVFPLIANGTQAESAGAYLALAPAVPLACIAAVLGGKFQGAGNMLPSAVAEVAAQAVKIILSLLFCLLLKYDVHRAVTTLCLAATLSVGAECLTLLCFKKKPSAVEKNRLLSPELQKYGAKNILSFTLPVTISAATLPFTGFIESLLLPRLFGAYTANPTALYGLFAGTAASISHLPATLCRGVAAAAIPDLSAEVKKNGVSACGKKIAYACFLNVAAALPACACLFAFSPLAVKILFSSLALQEQAMLVACIRTASPGVLFFSLAQTLSACLTALNKPRAGAACWGTACLFRLLLDLLLAGAAKFSINGAAIAEVGGYFLAFLLILLYNLSVLREEKRGEVHTPINTGENPATAREGALKLFPARKKMRKKQA